MTSPTLLADPPRWPHCRRGHTETDPVGCRGRTVGRYGACLAHLTDADRAAYLAGLTPGTEADHCGTTFTEDLLNQLLTALRDPAIGRPRLGDARFEGAAFSAGAGFENAGFSGGAVFDGATFCADARFDGTAFETASVLGPLVCRGLLTWGATEDETTRTYPGDELVPDADSSSTMATTLPAPPEKVWAWLVQMGGDRAGWYSWDRLDHSGEPSADRIVPEWQRLREGQRLRRLLRERPPDGQSWFTVAVLEPNRTLVLRSNYELPSGRSFDPRSAPLPRAYMEGIWGFHLSPVPGGRTRLVVRTRGRGRPRPVTRPFDLLLGEPLHFIMQARQFRNLRTRVGAEA